MRDIRKWFLFLFAAILLIGIVGPRWKDVWAYIFGGVSPLWECIVNWIGAIDRWLIDHGFFPSFIAIGIVGLIVTYFWPGIWQHLRRYSYYKKKFDEEFYDVNNVQLRESLRRQALQKYSSTYGQYNSAPPTLAGLLRQVDSPPNLPLDKNGSLLEWARSVPNTFTGREQELWDFVVHIYPRNEPYVSHEGIYLARNMVAKFWDSWGRAIDDGKLREQDIADQLKSNALDLRLLSYLEPAQVLQAEWDKSPGKSGLFSIARRASKYIETE